MLERETAFKDRADPGFQRSALISSNSWVTGGQGAAGSNPAIPTNLMNTAIADGQESVARAETMVPAAVAGCFASFTTRIAHWTYAGADRSTGTPGR